MSIILEEIGCRDFSWVLVVNKNTKALEAYINSLETRQGEAITAVASEVGAARGGTAKLVDRLDAVDATVSDAVALSESVILGDQATIFDPAASYTSPKLVVYDGDTYRCLSGENVIGVLPTNVTVWKKLTNINKAETPNLILKSSSENMGVTAKGRVVLDYDANLVWDHNLPDFAVVKITDIEDEGYVTGKDLWEFSFKAPIVTENTVFLLKLAIWFGGVNISEAAVASFTSIFVPIQDGATMAYANTVEAFPGATVDAAGIQPPAYSVGATNAKQIVSGKMEVEV
ncbi:hypothetical protein, partial [Maridesulfovibrio ferrireducens]|uniref:hypothetical protein n=1 Tax=Maridesulfovibrio ferrireducens TaxID=246191 RepID=UPI001A240DF0